MTFDFIPNGPASGQSDHPTVELNGVVLKLVLYGSESGNGEPYFGDDEELPPCRDCGTEKGNMHFGDCCVQQCPSCEGQFWTCDCIQTINGEPAPWERDDWVSPGEDSTSE
jgi:hypothetical protein